MIANKAAASYGGGVFAGTVYDSRIIGNSSGNRGGGVNQATVYRSLIAGNTGSSGGGGSDCALYECLVVSNTGGGVYFNGLTGGYRLRLRGCTVAYHTSGNGMWVQGAGDAGSVWVTNSIFYQNGANDLYFQTGALAYTNAFGYCCIGTTSRALAPGQGNISADPEWIDPDACDYRLGPDSPCLNVGTNQPWMLEPGAADIAGQSRIDRFSGQVDMGAYERLPSGNLLILR